MRGFSFGQALAALVLVSAGPLCAQTSAPAQAAGQMAPAPAPAELAAALFAYGSGAVAADDLRAIVCEVVSDAPGAVDCRWEQRMAQGWRLQTTWLAVVSGRWTVMDAPLPVPAFDRGRLKPRDGAGAS